LCSECKNRFYEAICLCRRVGICKPCLLFHVSSQGSHFIEYIRIEKQSKDTSDLDKKPGTENIKMEVIENIKNLEEYKGKVAAGRDLIIEAVKKAAEDLISTADLSKKKMELALETIKNSRVPSEDQWPYNIKKRQGCMTPSRRAVTKDIRLCETELNVDTVLKSVSNLGRVMILGDITPKQESSVYFFKPKARELIFIEVSSFYVVKKIFPKNLLLPDAGSWCEGPQKQIIFCGGCKSTGFTNEVFVIDPITLNFKILPVMKFPRAMAAVAYLNDCFYVFGGYSGTNLNVCEKYNFNTGTWKTLPCMPVARSAFNIAICNAKLYMNGDSKDLDIFDTETDKFIRSDIILPEATYSSLVAFKNNFLLIQNDGCWAVGLETGLVNKVGEIPFGKWWSCFPPYIYNNIILLVRYDDGCLWVYDTVSNSIIKKYKLI
jgi:Kelch motif